jgi:hypothetical protein
MLDPAIFFFKDPATQRGRPLMYTQAKSSALLRRFLLTPMMLSRNAAAVSISVEPHRRPAQENWWRDAGKLLSLITRRYKHRHRARTLNQSSSPLAVPKI